MQDKTYLRRSINGRMIRDPQPSLVSAADEMITTAVMTIVLHRPCQARNTPYRCTAPNSSAALPFDDQQQEEGNLAYAGKQREKSEWGNSRPGSVDLPMKGPGKSHMTILRCGLPRILHIVSQARILAR
ncbi:uncharacterized protein CIMG_10621 [Coccidioides immitis RS]|uniref:Uncharacterized protein n=1 Tax=Coccidioides immitis (strain RS) TaxID=246410 RepID=A0A0D8JSK7_COCIM|nr:uncharacterized protein CIMG_10621 [Coccidioides immitis RS]KJF60267.1 hypothetical protein CIMG_10621 [Coccidioides immitis RS]